MADVAERDVPVEQAKDDETVAEQPEVASAKAAEEEQDAKVDDRPGLTTTVGFHRDDTTFDVMPSAGGKILMKLTEGSFQYLLAGARANIGVTSGRYMFEVVALLPHSANSSQKHLEARVSSKVVRIGFASSAAPLVLSDEGPESVSFDNDGYFLQERSQRRVAKAFECNQVMAVLLNLDSDSPNANTVSLFCGGQRVSEPMKLPEFLLGRPLFPAVSFRGVALKVHFGAASLRPLPFRCLTLQQAAQADTQLRKAAVSTTDGKPEVIFPVGLPDEGTFHWLDSFLARHPGVVELSARAAAEWGKRSGLSQRGGAAGSNDRPEVRFGIAALDDASLPAQATRLATAVRRSFVVAEVQGNLIAASRRKTLARFSGEYFRRVALVVMGEPPEEYKEQVRASFLADRRRKAAKVSGEGEVAEVELTAEEKKAWFYKGSLPDVSLAELSSTFSTFSLPEVEEGFDEIRYEWQPREKCEVHMKEWLLQCKATQRVEDLQPSKWFAGKLAEWQKALQDWKTKQKEWKQVLEQLSEWKKEGSKKDEDGAKDADERPTEIDADDLDVFQVQDINDIGSGEPLFASFVDEDWVLLERRFELHLLMYAFRHDVDDADRPMFHERHLGFYYKRYFKKEFDLWVFGCSSNKDFLDIVKDSVVIKPGTGMLEPQLSEDTPMDNFVRLTEEHRRDRQRRIDAGDETAALKFRKHPPIPAQTPARRPPPPPQPQHRAPPPMQGSSFRGGVGGRPGTSAPPRMDQPPISRSYQDSSSVGRQTYTGQYRGGEAPPLKRTLVPQTQRPGSSYGSGAPAPKQARTGTYASGGGSRW